MTSLNFRQWLRRYAGQDDALGELARHLDPRKTWRLGRWTAGQYEEHLRDNGASAEAITALGSAWTAWKAERAKPRSETAPRQREPGWQPPRRSKPKPPPPPRPDVICVVLVTGARAATETVSRDEFQARMAGNPILKRIGDQQRYAVLPPGAIAQWRQSEGKR